MNAADYLRTFRERWIVLLTVVLLSLAVAAGAYALQRPTYVAKLTTYVSASTAGAENAAFQGNLLSQQRVASYVELARSETLAERVIQARGLTESPSQLARRVTASSVPDSVLVEITVADESPQRAAAIANAVGDALISLVDELERPDAAGAVAEVRVRAVAPAKAPSSSSSTSLPVYLAIGLLLGLGLGVLAALIRNALDSSLKTVDQLRAAAGVPVLATIPVDPKAAGRPLPVREDPYSPLAEAFRHLRTSLQFLQVGGEARLITVTSSLPGEGKTTVVCNLGIALASAGTRVLIVEADLRRPRFADRLGLERSVGLTSVLAGHVDLGGAIQPWAGGVMDVITSGPLPPNPSELLASTQMAALLSEVRDEYDYVLVDTPPLLPVTDAAALTPSTDGAILLGRYKKTRRTNVEAAAGSLVAISARLLGTVFTMVPDAAPQPYKQHKFVELHDPIVPKLRTGRRNEGRETVMPPSAPQVPQQGPRNVGTPPAQRQPTRPSGDLARPPAPPNQRTASRPAPLPTRQSRHAAAPTNGHSQPAPVPARPNGLPPSHR